MKIKSLIPYNYISSTYIIPILEAIYIIYMWNFFKTTYSFHNIWETNLMSHPTIPNFFKHQIKNTDYSNKICPLGNFSAYLLAFWIIITKIITPQYLSNKTQQYLKTTTKVIFTITAILAFIMNLNAFIYLIPIFIYELTD